MAEPVVQKHLTVEVLAPLHIGDGERLRRKEFAPQDRQVLVADPHRLLARVEQDRELSQAFLAFCEDAYEDLSQFLERTSIRPEEVGYCIPATGAVGSEILPFIKTMDQRPYLPGSSLKGALRSTLLRHALYSDPERLNGISQRVHQDLSRLRAEIRSPEERRSLTRQWRRRISDGVERSFFGPDQHHDLMRCIQISDSTPVDLSNLQVAEVRVLSVRGNRLIRKQTRRGRDMLINPEVATRGTFVGSLTFNLNLIADRGPASELGFYPKRDVVLDFASACNEAAEVLIEQEIAFYDAYGERTLVDWYRRLSTQLSRLQEGQCLLYMAWGSGFSPKTVTNLFSDELFENVRWAFRLGKFDRDERGRRRMVKPFPKSRKVVFENGRPSKPLGWVKLTVE